MCFRSDFYKYCNLGAIPYSHHKELTYNLDSNENYFDEIVDKSQKELHETSESKFEEVAEKIETQPDLTKELQA